MIDPWDLNYPATLPPVQVTPLVGGAGAATCHELQWWFAVPRIGDHFGGAWYDRATGELTMVRSMARPIAPADSGGHSVRIDIDEWTREPGSTETNHTPISITARLASERSEFISVSIGDQLIKIGDPGFEADWGSCGPARVIDDGRFDPIGERCHRTTTQRGIGAGLVRLTVAGRTFRCLRALDVPAADGTHEIGQPLIDVSSGRTLAYWQYRPTGWDTDADHWIDSHAGDELIIDEQTFQRRNCTGRDEIALTAFALGLLAP
jgi:hypothetical protein